MYNISILAVTHTMVQYIEKYKKNIAIDMRKRGLSYSEIENRIHVPKSTLSFWLKNLKLSEEQKKRLDEKRIEGIKKGAQKKILKTIQAIEEISGSSARDIQKISKREFWLMGVMLYWRERFLAGNKNDLRKGVRFSSSDPDLIKLFLKWLKDIGKIKDEEIGFDIFIGGNRGDSVKNAVDYWSKVTDFPADYFLHIYFQNKQKSKKRSLEETGHGFLRVRVKASSMLARQIYGWISGIKDAIDI